MTKNDVLQALMGLRFAGGFSPLSAGRIQDIAVDDGRVAIFIDDGAWPEGLTAEQVTTEIQKRVAAIPGVVAVDVEARGAEAASKARPARASLHPSQPPPKVPEGAHLLAVASGKGGVGKSSVSVNLAVALARRGRGVALLDCDIYGFSVPALIGVTEAPVVHGKSFAPPVAHGVEVMSIDFFVRDNQAVVWRGPMLGKAIRQLMQDTLWSSPEIMILDLPPGTGDVALDVHQYFPDATELIVTTPDPFAAGVAVRAGSMARETGHRILGVVENMAYMACGECGSRSYPLGRGGGDRVAQLLETEVVARIPFEHREAERLDGLFAAESGAGREYDRLAELFAGNDAPF